MSAAQWDVGPVAQALDQVVNDVGRAFRLSPFWHTLWQVPVIGPRVCIYFGSRAIRAGWVALVWATFEEDPTAGADMSEALAERLTA